MRDDVTKKSQVERWLTHSVANADDIGMDELANSLRRLVKKHFDKKLPPPSKTDKGGA